MAQDKIIAVLSGKGGTGKTLVAVNLAAAATRANYADCDIEEPDGHLFFKPQNIVSEEVIVKIPYVDSTFCSGCKKCVEFCRFNALAYAKRLLIFPEVCHSCGGCALVCPEKAIGERDRAIGTVETGVSGNVCTVSGAMNAGEASGVPIIKRIKEIVKGMSGLTVLDCPPGSACAVMESIREADYCLLVGEPTVFGAHNLAMVYELTRFFNKPCGAVLNKCGIDFDPSKQFCMDNNINILAEIPFDRALGVLSGEGRIAVREDGKYRKLFSGLLERMVSLI